MYACLSECVVASGVDVSLRLCVAIVRNDVPVSGLRWLQLSCQTVWQPSLAHQTGHAATVRRRDCARPRQLHRLQRDSAACRGLTLPTHAAPRRRCANWPDRARAVTPRWLRPAPSTWAPTARSVATRMCASPALTAIESAARVSLCTTASVRPRQRSSHTAATHVRTHTHTHTHIRTDTHTRKHTLTHNPTRTHPKSTMTQHDGSSVSTTLRICCCHHGRTAMCDDVCSHSVRSCARCNPCHSNLWCVRSGRLPVWRELRQSVCVLCDYRPVPVSTCSHLGLPAMAQRQCRNCGDERLHVL